MHCIVNVQWTVVRVKMSSFKCIFKTFTNVYITQIPKGFSFLCVLPALRAFIFIYLSTIHNFALYFLFIIILWISFFRFIFCSSHNLHFICCCFLFLFTQLENYLFCHPESKNSLLIIIRKSILDNLNIITIIITWQDLHSHWWI